MSAFGQYNLGLCGDQRPSAQLWGLRPSFGAFTGGGGHTEKQTDRQTFRKYILV